MQQQTTPGEPPQDLRPRVRRWIRESFSTEATDDELDRMVERTGLVFTPQVLGNRISNDPCHLRDPKARNHRKAICSLDYQYKNRYSRVPARVNCGYCFITLLRLTALELGLLNRGSGRRPDHVSGDMAVTQEDWNGRQH